MKSLRSSLSFRFVTGVVLLIIGTNSLPWAIAQFSPITLTPCTGDALNESNKCVKNKRCSGFRGRCGSYVLADISNSCNGPDPSDGDNCIVATDDPKVQCAIRGKCKLDTDGISCVADTTHKIWTDNAYDAGDCTVPNDPS
jgi:hypothetical protein